MSDTGVKYPNSAVDQGGSYAWTNVNNVKADDAAYATRAYTSGGDLASLQLVSSGSVVGSSKVASGLGFSLHTISVGDSSDVWGATLTPAIVNSSTFGVDAICKVASTPLYANTIRVTDFGFSVPSGATIDGVVVSVEGYTASSRVGGTIYLDFVQITVYYTEGGGGGISIPVVMHQLRQQGIA